MSGTIGLQDYCLEFVVKGIQQGFASVEQQKVDLNEDFTVKIILAYKLSGQN